MGIVRCCWKPWWMPPGFGEPATGPPTGSTLGRPPDAVAWTGSTKATVKPSKTSTFTRWSAMPDDTYAAIPPGKQIQKKLACSTEDLRPMVDRDHAEISIRRQCQLLGANRSGLYYQPLGESEENLQLMRLLDEQYTRTPFYGSRRMVEWLATQGFEVNRKRVARLMEVMGIEAVYPKPKLSLPGEGHKIYPYLLREVKVTRLNQVWSTDITYIRMAQGFVYLVAVMDWFSRYILSWRLSLTLELDFCIEALKYALRRGRPKIFNSDQGSQFTSEK